MASADHFFKLPHLYLMIAVFLPSAMAWNYHPRALGLEAVMPPLSRSLSMTCWPSDLPLALMALCNPLIARSSCRRLRLIPSREMPCTLLQSISLPRILPRSIKYPGNSSEPPRLQTLTW
eukprot:16428076-Heterocapsa_arctica.AAC.1